MLTAVDTGDQIAVVAVIVGIATGLIAVAALVVAWKARGDARRSADAAEESARQARRSADAEERAVALSQHEAEQRAANRHKDDGPGFVRVAGYVMDRTAHAELRIIAGPGRVVLDVRADAPWCSGICSSGKGPVGESITYPPMHPGRHSRSPRILAPTHGRATAEWRYRWSSTSSPAKTRPVRGDETSRWS
jgi:hypothetical protein